MTAVMAMPFIWADGRHEWKVVEACAQHVLVQVWPEKPRDFRHELDERGLLSPWAPRPKDVIFELKHFVREDGSMLGAYVQNGAVSAKIVRVACELQRRSS